MTASFETATGDLVHEADKSNVGGDLEDNEGRKASSAGDKKGCGTVGLDIGTNPTSLDELKVDDTEQFEREISRRDHFQAEWTQLQNCLAVQLSALNNAWDDENYSTIFETTEKMMATVNRLHLVALRERGR